MVQNDDIKIFDYIYQSEYSDDENSLSNFLENFFDNKIQKYFTFVDNYKSFLVDPELLVNNNTIIKNNFPRLNSSGVDEYFTYKFNQFKKILDNNINYNFINISKDLNLNGVALKRVIDYFIDRKIIKCNGSYATKNILGIFDFDFERLEVVQYYNSDNNINNQVNITINGDNNKFNNNDFSNNKKEIEKETFFDKIIKILKNVFKLKK